MKKYILLLVALVSVLCIYLAISEKDKVMIALLAVNALFCIIAQFVLLKEKK